MPLFDVTGMIEDRIALIELADAQAALGENPQPNQNLGVMLANNTDIAELADILPHLALLSVVFPSFSDGRGFSLARRLRATGYTGRLRASGPLIVDQFCYALACGFDEIDLPEASFLRQPLARWLAALTTAKPQYQRGYERGETIQDARQRARQQARQLALKGHTNV
jgi:uncharacterized protein (DUF934 family)